MMYAALAGFALGLMAWDFGRRWLTCHERAVEAALIRECEMRDEFSHAVAKLSDALGDMGTTSKARMRELSDRLDSLVDGAILDYGERLDRLTDSLDGLKKDTNDDRFAIAAFGKVVSELEQRPAESPDVTALRDAIATQEKAIKNFWELVGQTFVTKEQLKTEVDSLKVGQSAVLATGTGNRFRTAR